MKCCTKCKQQKPTEAFNKRSDRKSGLRSRCKECEATLHKAWSIRNGPRVGESRNEAYRAYYSKNKERFLVKDAKRRAFKAQAIPAWAEHDKIRQVYTKAGELGLDVDHIVPLQSDLVCGLHCWANLQLLDSSLNSSKGNREWPEMF